MAKKASPLVHDIWLLMLRVIASGAMLTHGIPKFLNLIKGNFTFPDPFGIGSEISLILAVSAEMVCSVLIILGILTRWASIPIIITMTTAIFFIHRGSAFSEMELAVMYLLAFSTIAIFGSGNFAISKLVK